MVMRMGHSQVTSTITIAAKRTQMVIVVSAVQKTWGKQKPWQRCRTRGRPRRPRLEPIQVGISRRKPIQ